MSRGRQAKADAKKTFLTQNPELIEYDTQISVTEVAGAFVPDLRDGLGQQIQDNEDAPFFLGGDVAIAGGLVTVPTELDLPDGVLFAVDTENPPSQAFGGDASAALTLTKNGLGVVDADEFENLGEDLQGDNPKVAREARGMDEGEIIVFGPDGLFGDSEDWDNPPFVFTDLLIEFTVLNNKAGTLNLSMEEIYSNSPVEHRVEIDAGSKNTTGQIELDFDLEDDFSLWTFGVEDGGLEVIVTGISYSGGPGDFIPVT